MERRDRQVDIDSVVYNTDVSELIELYENSDYWRQIIDQPRFLSAIGDKYGIQSDSFVDFIIRYDRINKRRPCMAKYGDVSRFECLLNAIRDHNDYIFDIMVGGINSSDEVDKAILESINVGYLHGIAILLLTKPRENMVYIEEAIATGDEEVIRIVIGSDVRVGIYYSASYVDDVTARYPGLMKILLEYPHYARLQHVSPKIPDSSQKASVLRRMYQKTPSLKRK